jgi:hypothetical protein
MLSCANGSNIFLGSATFWCGDESEPEWCPEGSQHKCGVSELANFSRGKKGTNHNKSEIRGFFASVRMKMQKKRSQP